ncbi:TPA: hypothetical protein N0F65_012973, partial [Lagenidium giganteum]
VLCRRLAEPSRWATLESEFGRSAGSFSRIFYCVVDIIYSSHKQRIYFNIALVKTKRQCYSATVSAKGATPGFACFAFIDGTKPPIFRPSPHPNKPRENRLLVLLGDILCCSRMIQWYFAGRPRSVR